MLTQFSSVFTLAMAEEASPSTLTVQLNLSSNVNELVCMSLSTFRWSGLDLANMHSQLDSHYEKSGNNKAFTFTCCRLWSLSLCTRWNGILFVNIKVCVCPKTFLSNIFFHSSHSIYCLTTNNFWNVAFAIKKDIWQFCIMKQRWIS